MAKRALADGHQGGTQIFVRPAVLGVSTCTARLNAHGMTSRKTARLSG